MKKARAIGSVILIEHSGEPTFWTVRKTGKDDTEHLLEIFDATKKMCTYELALGGTLKLLDASDAVIKEHRGRVA